MIELHLTDAPRMVRQHLRANVEARETPTLLGGDPLLLFQDDVILDQAKSRADFAAEVAQRSGNGTVPQDLEKDLLKLYEEAKAKRADAADADDDDGRSASTATKLVRLAHQSAVEFFKTPAGGPMLTLDDGQGHHMTMVIGERGGVLREWLCRAYYLSEGAAPNGSALTDALGPLRAKALFDGATHEVYTRIAGDATTVLIDLGDDSWDAIDVTTAGWRIVSQPPVKFRRPQGMLPLPRPVHGGSLDELYPFLNLGTGADAVAQRIRFLSFLMDCFRPGGPYAILGIFGPEGSGKSTTSRIIRALVDPAKQPVIRPPRSERNLYVRASNCAVVTMTNVSDLSEWLSDALCSITSGEGQSERQLYADDVEHVFDVIKPVIVNGIEELGDRRDYLSRQIPLRQPFIPKRSRKQERTVWRNFEKIRPRVLGVLLDAVAAALAAGEDVEYGPLPRLADSAHWAARCLAHFGFDPATVLKSFHQDAATRHTRVLDASPIAGPLIALVRSEVAETWEGLVSELLAVLNEARTEKRPPKDWPVNASMLAKQLQRIETSLAGAGLQVELPKRTKRGQVVRLIWAPGPHTDDDTDDDYDDTPLGSDDDPTNPDDGSDGEPGTVSHAVAKLNVNLPTLPTPPTQPNPDKENSGVGSGDVPTPGPTPLPTPPTSDAAPTVPEPDERPDETTTDGPPYTLPYTAPYTTMGAETGGNTGVSATGVGSVGSARTITPNSATGSVRDSYTLLAAPADVAAVLPALMATDLVGIDTETTGLDPHRDRIRLIQLATADQTYILDAFACDPRTLTPLFDGDGPRLAGQNLSFDLQMLHAAGLPIPAATRLVDTMLAAQLLGASSETRPKGYYGLEQVAERYLGVTLDKTLQTSKWSEALSTEQLTYAALDAAVLVPLAARLEDDLRAAELARVMAIEMAALPAVAWLETTGAPFDVNAWATLSDTAALEQQQALATLNALGGPPDLFGPGLVKWNSPTEVLKLFRALGHAITHTDEATLVLLTDCEPRAQPLLDYRDATKRTGMYGLKFAAQWVHPTTSRIHARYLQCGSRAGRMSCIQPNLQQIPRLKLYRACFQPPPGRVLVIADYSQIELRIAAQLSRDPAMLAAYGRGEDLHVTTAAAVLGSAADTVTKAQRQLAKALNFGLIYGAGSKTLRQHAAETYRVTLTEIEADRFRGRFFRAYPGLRRWQQQYSQAGAIETRTLAGRRRLGVERYTEKLNTPDQGTGADGFKRALGLLWERRARCPSAAPVLAVHDEIVIECDAEQAEAAQAWVTSAMVDGMKDLLPAVPVVVEAAIGQNWSEKP